MAALRLDGVEAHDPIDDDPEFERALFLARRGDASVAVYVNEQLDLATRLARTDIAGGEVAAERARSVLAALRIAVP